MFYQLFQSFNQLFESFNRIWSNLIKSDQSKIKIVTEYTIFIVRFKSDQNQLSNLNSLESESLMIRFWNPNHLSLPSILFLLTWSLCSHFRVTSNVYSNLKSYKNINRGFLPWRTLRWSTILWRWLTSLRHLTLAPYNT